MSDYDIENQMVPFSFFQSVIEMLPVAIQIINEEQAPVLSNSLFSEMFSWREQFPFAEEIEQTFLFKTAINSNDFKISNITGDVRSVHLLIEPLFDHSDVIGAVVIIQDITNIVAYQLENTQLSNTVRQLKELLEQKEVMLCNKDSQHEEGVGTSTVDTIQQNDESMRADIDYTSRDDSTWLAIREIRNNIKNRVPTYVYGERGLEKRSMVKQILKSMLIRNYNWLEIKTSKQVDALKSVIELKNTLVIIDVEKKAMLQPAMELLMSVTDNANCSWILIGDEQIQGIDTTKQVTIIRIPSLRERKADVLLLFDKLLPLGVTLDEQVKKKCIQYHWPKNIRELRSVARYADSMRAPSEQIITLEHVGIIALGNTKNNIYEKTSEDTDLKETTDVGCVEKETNQGMANAIPTTDKNALDILLQSMDKSNQRMPDIFDNIEKIYIEQILQKSDYNITHTANKLGIKRQALQYKLKKYNLAPDEVISKLN